MLVYEFCLDRFSVSFSWSAHRTLICTNAIQIVLRTSVVFTFGTTLARGKFYVRYSAYVTEE